MGIPGYSRFFLRTTTNLAYVSCPWSSSRGIIESNLERIVEFGNIFYCIDTF